MALVSCSECMGRVSSYAKFCPHCGAIRTPDLTPEQEQERLHALQSMVEAADEYAKSVFGEEEWAVKQLEINRRVAREREQNKRDASRQLLYVAMGVAGILLLVWLLSM